MRAIGIGTSSEHLLTRNRKKLWRRMSTKPGLKRSNDERKGSPESGAAVDAPLFIGVTRFT